MSHTLDPMELPPHDDDPTHPGTDETWAVEGPESSDQGAHAGLVPGTVVAGRYRIDAYLASGGMGQVYRAHDLTLDVSLALKTIRPEIASNPASLRLFKQEVLLARSVSHPNVCRIFDLWQDEDSGVTFLTMEFLPGETLAAKIGGAGSLSAEDSLPLVREMAEALDAAHRAAIVHRDFKSANVMVVPSGNGVRAVITDFGLAVTFGSSGATTADPSDSTVAPEVMSTPTVTSESPESDDETQVLVENDQTAAQQVPDSPAGAIVGTPAYMSPEQVVGDPVGPSSDLYALGIVLFEMRTGQLPFREKTALETARARLSKAPPNPRAIAGIDERWEKAILRLLARRSSDRFATGHDLVLALEGQTEGARAIRHFLPAELDVFVGRRTELDAIARSLEGSDDVDATRLLTLQGPGGTGKTRLVQKYAWDSLSRWPGGIWFCDLSEARTVDGIAGAVAGSLDVPLGREDPVVQLGNAIAGRAECLLILDNFEQVVDHAEATIGRWMERASGASFLVTSRERLQLPAGTTQEIEPLDPATQGVELFEVRAKGHRAGFDVTDANRKQVEEIVLRLDGLPLAIELAAARLRVLNLDQLRDRLRDRFKILSGGRKGRHATLRATLDWSWELLQPWEQSAMLQVSVFEGGFTLEAAEDVVDLSHCEDDPLVLDVIQSLVDKSWLRAKVKLGAPRFEMYTTVQEYTTAKLRESDSPPEGLEVRHGRHFAVMGAKDAVADLSRHGGAARVTALHLELDNLVAACRRSIERRDEPTATATYVAAYSVLTHRGPLALSVQLGQAVLEIVDDKSLRAHVLRYLGLTERILGRVEDARAHFDQALIIYRTAGDRSGEGRVLAQFGALHRTVGEMPEAEALGEEALAIHRELGEQSEEGNILQTLGNVHLQQGNMDRAQEHYEASLAIHQRLGNLPGQADALLNLGNLHSDQGKFDQARQGYEKALTLYREMGNGRGAGVLFAALAGVDRVQGRIEDAYRNYEMALSTNREMGDLRVEGICLLNLATLLVEQFRMDEGRERLETSLIIFRQLGNRDLEGCSLYNLGNLCQDLGLRAEAREHYELALTLHRGVGNRRYEGAELGALGTLLREDGLTEEARERYLSALALHREVGNRSFEGVVHGDLGVLNQSEGRLEDAREEYETALTILREVGQPRFEAIVIGYLGDLYLKQDCTDEAREQYETALAIHQEQGNRYMEGALLRSLGDVHVQDGRAEDARRFYAESITILRDLDRLEELVKVLTALGNLELEEDNREAAEAALAEAALVEVRLLDAK